MIDRACLTEVTLIYFTIIIASADYWDYPNAQVQFSQYNLHKNDCWVVSRPVDSPETLYF